MPQRTWFNVIYFSHSLIHLLYLFTNLPLNLFFYLKEKKIILEVRTFTNLDEFSSTADLFYDLKLILYKADNSFVMLPWFQPTVSLLRCWCRKHTCSAESFVYGWYAFVGFSETSAEESLWCALWMCLFQTLPPSHTHFVKSCCSGVSLVVSLMPSAVFCSDWTMFIFYLSRMA